MANGAIGRQSVSKAVNKIFLKVLFITTEIITCYFFTFLLANSYLSLSISSVC